METIELIKRSRSGDKLAREQVIKENMPLVYSIVKRFAGRGYDVEDLSQIGAIGLIKAVDNFNLNYDVKFLTGSDEHGKKIEKKAKELKMDNQAYVDMQTSKFIDLWNSYQIDYDFFSRTTNNEHKECIIKIFNEMLEKKLIYKGLYKGLYSVEVITN